MAKSKKNELTRIELHNSVLSYQPSESFTKCLEEVDKFINAIVYEGRLVGMCWPCVDGTIENYFEYLWNHKLFLDYKFEIEYIKNNDGLIGMKLIKTDVPNS